MATSNTKTKRAPVPPPATAEPGNWTLSRRWLIGVALLLAAPWCVVMALVWQSGALEGSDHPAGSAPAATSGVIAAATADDHEANWGNLQIIPIVISPPLEFVDLPVLVFEDNRPGSTFDWHFENTSREDLKTLLRKVGLTTAEQTRLLATVQDLPERNGLRVSPDDDLVRGLSPEARAVVYHRLADCDLNIEQCTSFVYCADTVDQWLANADLAPRTIDLVRPLIYRNGRFLFFADFRFVWPELPDRDERVRLLRAMSREVTYLIKLHVDGDSDVDALVKYWGVGGREQQVRPLLESLAEVPGGGSIDITHLLPPYARSRLYTYPNSDRISETLNRDCHWSAMNFFNEQPDDRFANPRDYALELHKNWRPIRAAELQLGDLVLYENDKDLLYHSAVYIANGILFTKNGSRPSRPWMLMTMDDMRDYYPLDGEITMRYFRERHR